jgi:hypothetical protein
MERLLSSNPLLGTRTVMVTDPYAGNGDLGFQTTQDVRPILEAARAERNVYRRGSRYGSKLLHKAATIPLTLLFELRRMGITPEGDPEGFKRHIREHYPAFLVRPGAL